MIRTNIHRENIYKNILIQIFGWIGELSIENIDKHLKKFCQNIL